jgi:hypothetical protein
MKKDLRTKSGTLIATGYNRVVHGGRGDYVEIETQHMVLENIHIPKDQDWRLSPKYMNEVFYDEYRSNDDSYVKIYFQRKYVGYADYNLGMYYIAPSDLEFDGDLE